jgi:hypothetical protein
VSMVPNVAQASRPAVKSARACPLHLPAHQKCRSAATCQPPTFTLHDSERHADIQSGDQIDIQLQPAGFGGGRGGQRGSALFALRHRERRISGAEGDFFAMIGQARRRSIR